MKRPLSFKANTQLAFQSFLRQMLTKILYLTLVFLSAAELALGGNLTLLIFHF